MAKTATSKVSDSFLEIEMEKFLPNKLLRDTIFVVVVIWGAAIILAALLFNIYLLTEEWAFLTSARLKTIVNFIEFSGKVLLFASIFMLGYMVRATRGQKRKTKSIENFPRKFS